MYFMVPDEIQCGKCAALKAATQAKPVIYIKQGVLGERGRKAAFDRDKIPICVKES